MAIQIAWTDQWNTLYKLGYCRVMDVSVNNFAQRATVSVGYYGSAAERATLPPRASSTFLFVQPDYTPLFLTPGKTDAINAAYLALKGLTEFSTGVDV
jgi:hypothetical protein